ncbi:MAG: class I SAM-dependent methyltransferase [Planctomycetota bacterium]|nr:MAG: class I SAM-dependent methyltransferase [Planctomycetota bacterium]
MGIEPWEETRIAEQCLAEHEGSNISLLEGTAESILLPSDRCNVVLANWTIEHMSDPQAEFKQVHRILKTGGLSWFYTASSLCPHQKEIAGFAFCGWYPDRLKHRIRKWAKTHKPHLIGHREKPAVNWFTPWKAKWILSQAGFKQVYDRWDPWFSLEAGRTHKSFLALTRP